ncbi:hypothetical protein VK199_26555 [Micromonospora sp. CCTCC AA 2012012]
MKVDDIRGQLRRRGVSGISALRKPELVKTLARSLRSEGRAGGAARGSSGPAGRASATKKTTAAKKTAGARKSAPSRAKAAPAAKASGARAKATPAAKASGARAKAAPGRKAAPAKKAAPSRSRTATTARTASARAGGTRAAPARAAAPATAGTAMRTPVRTGRSSARSVSSSQQITSLSDRPERPGRSLVTANHEVIQRWARARNAKPATIAGTEREGRPGVLTFNIPGYRESSRIREISWDDWFRTFDSRGLNLIYQEQLRDGRQSNFFRTENPDREDG